MKDKLFNKSKNKIVIAKDFAGNEYRRNLANFRFRASAYGVLIENILHTESFRTAWQGKLAEEFRRLANDSQERRLCDVFCSQHPKNLADSV